MTTYVRPTINEIVTAVAEEFQVAEKDIRSFYRARHVVRAKVSVSFLAFCEYQYGVTRIGRALSRDHTTIISNVESAKELIMKDRAYGVQLEAVKEALKDLTRKPKPAAMETDSPAVSYADEIRKRRREGWSLQGICKRYNLAPEHVAPIIGVQLMERA